MINDSDGFEILTAVTIRLSYWQMTPYSLVEV
jgi:hypothetical protein